VATGFHKFAGFVDSNATLQTTPIMKLMIVDDHTPTREFIREILQPFVTAICECGSAEEALDRCQSFKPDLVTMDLQMQPMNGFEATRQLLLRHPVARVVMVTQSDQTILRLAAARAGADHFIHKDDFAELRGYAEQQMHRHAAARGMQILPLPQNQKPKSS
jgi:DNA-binding NarL/FixJ family response regulator